MFSSKIDIHVLIVSCHSYGVLNMIGVHYIVHGDLGFLLLKLSWELLDFELVKAFLQLSEHELL